jgi:hypothetical protein
MSPEQIREAREEAMYSTDRLTDLLEGTTVNRETARAMAVFLQSAPNQTHPVINLQDAISDVLYDQIEAGK